MVLCTLQHPHHLPRLFDTGRKPLQRYRFFCDDGHVVHRAYVQTHCLARCEKFIFGRRHAFLNQSHKPSGLMFHAPYDVAPRALNALHMGRRKKVLVLVRLAGMQVGLSLVGIFNGKTKP